jgi:hypothetical protein
VGLIIRCEDHLKAVKEFAASVGMLDQLNEKLNYLASYGKDVETHCNLHKDFAEHSFYFEMMLRCKDRDPEWQFWFNGGLIYHGDDTGWGVHT